MVFLDVLTNGVPKVPKGCSEGFCHFCHPLTLDISKVAPPDKGVKRRVIQHKRDPGWTRSKT